jgi:ATP-dependent Clp endopeptidase proteolytic subunit ClpP
VRDSDRDHQRRARRRAYDIYSRLRDGVIFVRRHRRRYDRNTAQLLFLENEAPETDIQLSINGPGGSLTAALSIYDAMQYVGPKVATLCTGPRRTCSILLDGDPGMRVAALIPSIGPSAGSRAKPLTSVPRRSSPASRRASPSTAAAARGGAR